MDKKALFMQYKGRNFLISNTKFLIKNQYQFIGSLIPWTSDVSY